MDGTLFIVLAVWISCFNIFVIAIEEKFLAVVCNALVIGSLWVALSYSLSVPAPAVWR